MFALLLFAAAVLQDPNQGFRISAEVEQVVLPVTVTDGHGVFVTGLNAPDFVVYEDGRPQNICFFSNRDVPVSVGIVVDSSSSMRPRRNATNAAALNFVRLSNPEDEAFIVNFNHNISFVLPQGVDFTSDREQLRNALAAAEVGGKTALYDAISASLDHLDRANHDRKALIVISDGGDTASRLDFHAVLNKARASQASIYTVVLRTPNEDDPTQRPDLMAKMARATGGDFYEPKDMTELYRACGRIARELRTQYTIAYTPDQPRHDGGYRTVRVTVRAPGHGRIQVRTRPGYFAIGEKRASAGSAR